MNAKDFIKENVDFTEIDRDKLPLLLTKLECIILMEKYSKQKVKKLTIPAVSKSFTAEQVVNELEECDTLDDAIIFFKEQI